jgi:hypothetical protein
VAQEALVEEMVASVSCGRKKKPTVEKKKKWVVVAAVTITSERMS